MSLRLISTAVLLIAAGCFSIQQASAQDAAVRVMASNGIRAALEELQPQCQRAVGHPLALQFSSTAALKKRIEAGEGFDVTVIASEAINDLIKEGKLGAGHAGTLPGQNLASVYGQVPPSQTYEQQRL